MMFRTITRTKQIINDAATAIRRPYELYRLKEGPKTVVQLSRNEALNYYTQMLTLRHMEIMIGKLYRDRFIRGFCHLYNGQEAIAVGMKAAMRKSDNIITSYRSHGWAHMMGISVQSIMAELMGSQSGCSHGKGGSMHMYSPNFYGGNGIVGAQVPLGAGIALASKLRCDGGVCLTLYGDGAANQGQVFETFNMAYLWKLPIVFVCENNNYGMGTSAERSSANPRYYTRGDLMPGCWVDGMDVLAVRNATEFAIEHALSKGPIILEMGTYRYMGHSMSDPGTTYRSAEEVRDVRRTRDPILLFKDLCQQLEIISDTDIELIKKKVGNDIGKAVVLAKADKELELKHIWMDVYANPLESKVRNVLEYTDSTIQERISF